MEEQGLDFLRQTAPIPTKRTLAHHSTTMNKKELRKEIRNRKLQYTQGQLKELSEPIINRLRHHPKLIAAKTVMLYHSLPVVTSETEMEIRRYTGPEDMKISSFNILEPVGESFVDYDKIDFIAVPGMSFDTSGNRLGRGKGYYDRFLKQARQAYKLGICFDFQKLDSIPADEYDEKVDAVL